MTLWKTKGEILKNVLVAAFHAITMNGNGGVESSETTQKHHKNISDDLFGGFQVFFCEEQMEI